MLCSLYVTTSRKFIAPMMPHRKSYIILLLILSLYTFSGCSGLAQVAERSPVITDAFQGQKGRIAFTSARSIWVINADGTGLEKLASGGRPSWSPDGQQILFTQGGLQQANVYTMNADGSNITQRTTSGGIGISWSPDGQLISFASREIGKDDLYIVEPDGSNRRKLADEGGHWHSWSFDGSKIAFRCHNVEICTVDRNNFNIKQITTNRAGNFDWVPDKLQLLFAGWDGGLYTINWDGTEIKKIAHPVNDETNPVLSPDGTKIAFIGRRSELFDGNNSSAFELYVINIDGSAVSRLTDRQNFEVTGEPSWSPDGLSIAFTARSTSGKDQKSSIYLVKADGSAITQLIQDADGPVWQPQ